METIEKSSQIKTRTGIITSAGTLLAENLDRRGLIIQNLNGANALFIKFGASASSTSFDLILKGGAAGDDGLGGTLSYDVLSYTGVITVAGTTVRCTATEW